MPRDFDDDLYVIDKGESDEVGLGHHGEGNQQVLAIGTGLPGPGRKPVYRPEFATQALKLCKFGATDDQLADFFEVHRATIYRWRAEYPDFAAATALGKEETDDRVEEALLRRAVGYDRPIKRMFSFQGVISSADDIEHIPPDVKAAIFWLKNRRKDKWRDVSEFTGAGGKPLIPQDPVTAKELARYLAFVVSQGAKQIDAEAVDADVQYLPAPDSDSEE
jgi:hypothetical protein